MTELRNAEVYRVCAVSEDRWDVYQEPRSMPVASFNDKAAALNYAMCLARGRVAWHLLLRNGESGAEIPVSAMNAANGADTAAPSRH